MREYKIIKKDVLSEGIIDSAYNDLLSNKWQFVVFDSGDRLSVLTKEKSLFDIDDLDEFLAMAESDIYYKTECVGAIPNISQNDTNMYWKYIDEYASMIEKTTYGGRYLFGCVAVKTDSGFVTTVRGKDNLQECAFVYYVNHNDYKVLASDRKATLNAPLLHYLFEKNPQLKVIVHLNGEFGENLPTMQYAFPGTVRDSIRDVSTSFNIEYHGVFYLFNKYGEKI
ncbi:MAG: hypothetical protein E7354_04120 [Clostridiales bacterium]|nr:hypothetical protein [Clostridiales bacterium]